ncbi:hypothetical protein Ccrd_007032 [Cynara cardunculus var. scolymus]|uniref:Uncharacterized protein n=1 Tax=Cynara cardunculus var. scolymus TaxID=59895 RepID=A0A103XHK6_CYNCS|nr:hypothetical protein Ccrd_007032 [Cynara cardunculus var. scolymus]
METGLRSRKRKQHPSKSDPIGGIFTRSKEQIYLHRHRSGYARADSVRNRNVIQLRRTTPKSLVSQKASEATSDQITNQVSVKDLRARRVFSPTTISDEVVGVGTVGLEADLDVRESNSGKFNVLSSEGDAVCSELGVSDSVVNDLKARSENVADIYSIRESNVMEVDEFVQMTPTIAEPDQNKEVGEKNGMISVANEIIDAKGSMSKSQYSATSLRGRRRVFKSPSSFSYRRLLPYLKDFGKDDSPNFEIVEATLPEKVQKSSNMSPNKAACKDQEIDAVSDCSKLADGAFNNVKNSEKQYSNSVNPNSIRTIESSGSPDVGQKSHEDVFNHTLEEPEQTTPPDSDIYCKPKIDKSCGVLVKPTDAGTVRNCSNEGNDSISASKLVLKPCSRMKELQMPTSFSHRRLLPFLMSVSRDDSCASKANQSLKLGKAMEQKQQPMLFSQRISMEDSKTNGNSGQPSTADEKSDSPTSTLIPIDASCDRIKTDGLVSSEIVMDIDETDMECSRSTSQLDVKLQAEAVKFDSSIKLEQELPKSNSECVEEPTSKAISLCSTTRLETLSNIGTEHSIDTTNDFMRIRNSNSEEKQNTVNEITHQSSTQIVPLKSPGIEGENFRNGILKRTPRGCRGTCNCLNCTSFRLHAERSFEFSRNQMHDAEEVALELIKDLAHLRNILERTASDSNYFATLKEEQVPDPFII